MNRHRVVVTQTRAETAAADNVVASPMMRLVRIILVTFFCLTCLLSFSTAQAHNMRVVYLEVTEHSPGQAFALQKATTNDDSIRVQFPSNCRVKTTIVDRTPPVRSYKLRCSKALAGQTIQVRGLGPVISEVVLRLHLAKGQSFSKLLTAQTNTFVIPTSETSSILTSYTWMGMTHVLGGWDHLLFLLALLLLVQSGRWMLLTVTAFTVSHSITLGLTTLGWLEVSSQAAEACIAWSLVLGAWEATRLNKLSNADRLATWMGFVFGFVHGLGFASSLLDIGLPQHAIPLSLLSFNIGVELGQLVFVVPGFLLLRWVHKHIAATTVSKWGAYVVGIPGAYWFWERLAAVI